MASKQTLRQDFIKRRQNIPARQRQAKNAAILQQVIDSIDWSSVVRLHLYDSRAEWGEVDTLPIIDYLSTHFPKIRIDIADQQASAPQPTDAYDVIIVPVLAYDSTNNRLGMGQGWYDRFLANQPTARKIGLAYTESFVDQLPVEPHDQTLDIIYSA